MKFLQQKHTRKEDLMLVNVIYNYASPETEWKDSIDIIYKDLNTEMKYLEHIVEPGMDIYFTKDEYRNYDYNKFVLPLDQVDLVNVSCKNVTRDIAKIAGGKYANYYRQCHETRNNKKKKNLHKYRYVMASDYDPESYYRIQWGIEYDNTTQKKITKLYSDIEVDGIDHPGFVTGGVAPINAIAILDEKTKKCYSFLLRNEKNPQIQEVEDNIEDLKNDCKEMFEEFYGEWDYQFLFYDEKDEIIMLKDYFRLIHTLKRDFLLFWNMNYDANYFLDRIKELGYNPADIMCHPDFKVKKCNYYADKKNFVASAKKDSFTVSDYTVWIDQMLVYAQVRKGQSELGSVRLNVVGKSEIGEAKIDYTEEANIKTLPYVDYKKFVLYNIKDTLLQFGIERKTSDIDNLYIRSIKNYVPYKKVFSQTALLRNRAYVDYLGQGYIVGNNINIDYEKDWNADDDDDDDDKFSGALVGDPMLNTNKNGMVVLGVKTPFLRKYVVDFDYSSLYPSIKMTHNIGPHTLVGKIILKERVYDRYTYHEMNNEKGDVYDSGKDFLENILCNKPVMTGVRWFNLPNMMEIMEMCAERFGKDHTKLTPEANRYRRIS